MCWRNVSVLLYIIWYCVCMCVGLVPCALGLIPMSQSAKVPLVLSSLAVCGRELWVGILSEEGGSGGGLLWHHLCHARRYQRRPRQITQTRRTEEDLQSGEKTLLPFTQSFSLTLVFHSSPYAVSFSSITQSPLLKRSPPLPLYLGLLPLSFHSLCLYGTLFFVRAPVNKVLKLPSWPWYKTRKGVCTLGSVCF